MKPTTLDFDSGAVGPAPTSMQTARARGELDASISHALMDVLQPRAITIARLVQTPQGPLWWVASRLRAGEIAALADAENDPERMGLPSAHPRRMEALLSSDPVVQVAFAGARGAGVLTIIEFVSEAHGPAVLEIETSAQPNTQDQRLITAVLRAYRQMDSLVAHPHRDPTTGLLNHVALEGTFEKNGLFSTARPLFVNDDQADDPDFHLEGDMDRRNAPPHPTFFLGAIDIDRFSEINAFNGLEAADQVLMLTARILRNTLRHRDRLYRMGADEIAAVVRCRSAADAAVIFERFRFQLNRFFFPSAGFITASIGLTQIRSVDTAWSALTRAQRAIEEAKEGGRDRVVCLDQSIADAR